MKPFNLEEAKAGKPVCRRDGTPARIICFDRISLESYPIIALVLIEGSECAISYAIDGRYNVNYQTPHKYDLMMVTKKHEGWINIKKIGNDGVPYADGVFVTEKQAKDVARIGSSCENHIATLKIEWEE